MQRRKVSVSVEVKQVIVALCKLLSATGLDCVPPPETFRRAKFEGGPDVNERLWQLLTRVLQRTCSVSLEISKQPRKDQWELVAAGLWQTGFFADWMYREHRGAEGGADWLSSKDLLLALVWLISKGAIEKLVSQRVEELDKTLLTSAPANSEKGLKVFNDIEVETNSMRRLQWLLGSLRHHGRILLSMQEERVRLLHKVLIIDPPSDAAAMSSDAGSALIKKDCVCLQELCGLLDAYLKWKQVESVFWTWMSGEKERCSWCSKLTLNVRSDMEYFVCNCFNFQDSVVETHLTDLKTRKPTQAPERSSVCRCGNQGLVKFDEVLQRSQMELCNKYGAEEHLAEGTLDPSLEALLYPAPSLPRVFRAQHQNKRIKPSPGTSQDLSAAQVLKLLKQREAELLKEREILRQRNRAHLEEIYESVAGQVLVPP